MENYVYIVAGLPEIALDFERGQSAYSQARDYFIEQLSEKDRGVVSLLEAGFDDSRLDRDFYERALKSRNSFIRNYFLFDLQLRDFKVDYLAQRLGRPAAPYRIDFPEMDDCPEEARIRAILENGDFVAREQQMDQLRWDKATELVSMQYFTLDVILAFLVKARLAQRWFDLDREKGAAMFRELVEGARKSINKEE